MGKGFVSKITRRNWKSRYPDKKAWDDLRAPIVKGKRDNQGKPYHAGHIIPLAKGGRNTRLNLKAESESRNLQKAARRPARVRTPKTFKPRIR